MRVDEREEEREPESQKAREPESDRAREPESLECGPPHLRHRLGGGRALAAPVSF